MAVDTRQRRASALLTIRPYVIAPPLPDGTVGTGDRFQIAWMFGSLADAGIATDNITTGWAQPPMYARQPVRSFQVMVPDTSGSKNVT